MPIAIAIIAALVIITGIKGNISQVGTQFNTTFFGSSGKPGFVIWAASLFAIAIVFRAINAPTAGKAFIGLLLLIYLMENSGALTTLETSLQTLSTSGATANNSTAAPNTSASNTPAAQPSDLGSALTSAANQLFENAGNSFYSQLFGGTPSAGTN